MDNRPIGIFDSGLGGLTVLKEIRHILPNENIVYFGDCGRAPYGVKSPETIRRYTFQNIRFFMEIGVKLLVIACNTSSACAYGPVTDALDIPVVEVIRPGSRETARVTRNRKIGIIGTTATIASRVYEDVFKQIDPAISVFTKACPLFVPLAEEGPQWWGHESSYTIAEEYLSGLRSTGIDSLLLGCTHYPLLGGVIRKVVGEGIELVSSGSAVASEVFSKLSELGLLRAGAERDGAGRTGAERAGTERASAERVRTERTGAERDGAERDGAERAGMQHDMPANSPSAAIEFYTSDSPEKFEPLCGAILGEQANSRAQWLDIEKYESRIV